MTMVSTPQRLLQFYILNQIILESNPKEYSIYKYKIKGWNIWMINFLNIENI